MASSPRSGPLLFLAVALVAGGLFALLGPSRPAARGLGPGEALDPSEARPHPADSTIDMEADDAPSSRTASNPRVERVRSLRVLWEDEASLAGAEILVLVHDELVASGQSDAAGRFPLPSNLSSDAEAWAFDGPLLLGHVLVGEDSESRIVVPLGSHVAGVVTVDGAPPGQVLALELDAPETSWGSLSPAIRSARRAAGDGRRLTVKADALGRFAARGLPASWSGWLSAPQGLSFLDGSASIALPQPTEDLLVQLASMPLLSGTVVGPGLAPAAGATVSYTLEAGPREPNGPSSRSSGSVTSDNTGRFQIPLGPEPPTLMSLSISAPDMGAAKLESALDGLKNHDVGTIRLSPLRDLTLQVVDPLGAPVTGAVVTHDGQDCAPTDARGLTQAQGLPLGPAELFADALGFARGWATVPGEAPEPFELVLTPVPSLEVVFTDESGEPIPGVTLALEGGAFLTGLPFEEGLAQHFLGASSPGPTSVRTYDDGHQESTASFTSDAAGRVLAVGLAPSVPIFASARDAAGAGVGWEATVTLADGERRRLDVQVPGHLSSLVGRVVNQAGTPVQYATVSVLTGDGEQAKETKTDSDGSFAIGPLQATTADIWIESRELAPALLANHTTDGAIEVQLEEGHSLALFARDSIGREWSISHATARRGPHKFTSTERGGSSTSIELMHLPDFPVQIEVRVAGCKLSAEAIGSETELTIAVPASGGAHLSFNPASLGPAPHDVSLTLEAQAPLDGIWKRQVTASELAVGKLELENKLAGPYLFRLRWKDTADKEGELRALGTIQAATLLELTLK